MNKSTKTVIGSFNSFVIRVIVDSGIIAFVRSVYPEHYVPLGPEPDPAVIFASPGLLHHCRNLLEEETCWIEVDCDVASHCLAAGVGKA